MYNSVINLSEITANLAANQLPLDGDMHCKHGSHAASSMYTVL